MADQSIFHNIRHWMFQEALPFWAESGPDFTFGGFIEALDFTGADATGPFKRTRVTCRQIYVFSHAKLLGWDDGEPLIAHGADYLINRTWNQVEGGFARQLTREGGVHDPTPDLYDHAFALFAFAWAYRATLDPIYYEWLHKTLDWIEANLRHPGGEGFWHETPAIGWRLQNPHMHMLEAALAALEATGENRFQDLAAEIVELFLQRFFNRETGTLAEYFADDWSVAPGEKGQIVEPGHQLEWAWILQSCRQASAVDLSAEIRLLVRFSEEHGLNGQTGAVLNAIGKDGSPIDAGSRTWPNTERLKAAVALFELDGSDTRPMMEKSSQLLFGRYLSAQPGFHIPRGAWIDAFDADGRPVSEHVPASTFYHVFLAFAEVLRLEGRLSIL